MPDPIGVAAPTSSCSLRSLHSASDVETAPWADKRAPRDMSGFFTCASNRAPHPPLVQPRRRTRGRSCSPRSHVEGGDPLLEPSRLPQRPSDINSIEIDHERSIMKGPPRATPELTSKRHPRRVTQPPPSLAGPHRARPARGPADPRAAARSCPIPSPCRADLCPCPTPSRFSCWWMAGGGSRGMSGFRPRQERCGPGGVPRGDPCPVPVKIHRCRRRLMISEFVPGNIDRGAVLADRTGAHGHTEQPSPRPHPVRSCLT